MIMVIACINYTTWPPRSVKEQEVGLRKFWKHAFE
jgi:hypothetical protein